MKKRTKKEYLIFAKSMIDFLNKENEKLNNVKKRVKEYERVVSINREIWMNNKIIEDYEADIKELNGEDVSRPWGESLKDRDVIIEEKAS